MTQRFDPDLINKLAAGGGNTPVATSRSTAASLLDEAVTRAVDWLAGGDRRSARVCVDHGSDRTWILLDTYTPRDSNELFYTARTNDIDLMCATPPSFHSDDTDPAVVHEAATAFLTSKYDGKDVRVLVFRSEGSNQEAVEQASSDDGVFRELPDFPIL